MRPSRQQINSLVIRYLEGKITKGDFDSFLNGLDEPEVRKIFSDQLKSSFEESLNQNNAYAIASKNHHFSQLLGKHWMGIAATMLVLATFSFLIYQNLQTPDSKRNIMHQTAFAEQKSISLPDGTEVNLNVVSSLEQLPFENQIMRKVNLSGEAFFEVAKDTSQPFEITTQSIKILVLGTAFNVESYDEDSFIKVSVTEGTVHVSLTWEDFFIDEILTINQQIRINKSNKTYEVVEFNEPIYWKSKVLNFDQSEFTQVIHSLKRWYGVELIVKDSSLYKLKISGQFKNKNIEEVIAAIEFLSNKESENSEMIEVISKKSTENKFPQQ
jgi:ferric-dicitrate binding protein FerR (iron transport regulator)